MKEAINIKWVCAAVLIDLSKLFGWHLFEPLATKLYVSRASLQNLEIHSCLSDKLVLTKVVSYYGEVVCILSGVSKGPILEHVVQYNCD